MTQGEGPEFKLQYRKKKKKVAYKTLATSWAPVTHAYNPSYLGGWGLGQDSISKQPEYKCFLSILWLLSFCILTKINNYKKQLLHSKWTKQINKNISGEQWFSEIHFSRFFFFFFFCAGVLK
jgi:hypothetical protein